jgi:thiol-disulfide isomerase/thioredoxin
MKPEHLVAIAITVLILLVSWVVLRSRTEGLGAYVPRPNISYYTSRCGGKLDTVYVALHGTTWCPACKMFRPTWEVVKKQLSGMNIVFDDIDEDVARNAWISQYPTVIMVYHGISSQYVGPNDPQKLAEFILDASKGSAPQLFA